jgi:hypothetical protein
MPTIRSHACTTSAVAAAATCRPRQRSERHDGQRRRRWAIQAWRPHELGGRDPCPGLADTRGNALDLRVGGSPALAPCRNPWSLTG